MTLLLLPNVLGDQDHHLFLPPVISDKVKDLQGLIAESEKEGRRFLRKFVSREAMNHIPIVLLNEHTKREAIEELLLPLQRGENWGLISDCGLPCIADPGSLLVARAHQLKIKVEAYAGPSSIFLALMLSGFSGQNFSFHGYVDKDSLRQRKQLKLWEKRALNEHETQICMEVPYKNQVLFETLLEVLQPTIKLCVAYNISLPNQVVLVKKMEEWKETVAPSFHKQPSLFLFC